MQPSDFVTRIITDQTGFHLVLLPLNTQKLILILYHTQTNLRVLVLIISNSSIRKIRVCGNNDEILNWSCPVLHLWSSRSTLVWGWGSHFWFDASKKHLQLAFRLLLQTKCRLSDKLRRLLCLLHKWHTLVSPPPLRHRLNRCWLKKLWILCNRIIIGYIYVYYALVLLQPVSALWLVMNTPLFKDQKKKTITTTK